MRYDLKTRKCIGNTSMDPLLAFIATNVASVSANSVVFDPFVGTGRVINDQKKIILNMLI